MVMCRRLCGGGPCDFSVSSSPLGLDFGTLDLGLTKIGKWNGLIQNLHSFMIVQVEAGLVLCR